jgi:Rrf2 family protein
MRLTTRSEYALLALIHLARTPPGARVTAKAIARAQQIPQPFLEQILRALKQARLVQTAKGQRGGYRLACPPKKISIAQVVRLFDGALAPTLSVSEYFYAHTPIERERRVVALFRGIRDYVARKLEKTTLADVI